jgi:hypothetical protein
VWSLRNHGLQVLIIVSMQKNITGKSNLREESNLGQFASVGKIAPAKYPNFRLDEHHLGTVVDIRIM